jgi:hypothetical protein
MGALIIIRSVAVRRGVVPLEQERAAGDDADDGPPVSLQERGGADHDARREGELHLDRGEHALEHRDDEDQQDRDRDGRHAHDDRRVDHGALHLAHQGVVLLEEDGQSQENGVENAARLARGHHVDEEARERLWVAAEGVGQGVAGLDVEDHLLGDILQGLVLGLVGQDRQRLHQRQARVDHRGELPGEDHDVARLDARLAQAEAHLLGRFPDAHQDHPVLPDVPDDLVLGLGLHLALQDLPVRGVLGRVVEERHRSFSSSR